MIIKCPSNTYIDSVRFVGKMYRVGDKGIVGIKTTMAGNVKVSYEIGTYILLSADGIEQINIRKYA